MNGETLPEFDTHVCLVSDEPLPNALCALDPVIGRARIVLLVSRRMGAKSHHLAEFLRLRGCTCIHEREIDDRGNLARFRDEVAAVVREFPGAALNATGGKKTMSIVAADVFRAAGRPVFYCERDNRVTWLSPLDLPQHALATRLGLDDYLAAFGQTIVDRKTEPLFDDGGPGALAHPQSLPAPGPGPNGEVFESLVFRAARHAIERIGGASPGTELAWGVKVMGGGGRDEFDVVAVHDNVLYLIECKNIGGTGLNGFINKLGNLRRRRGLTARAALVCSRPVPPTGGNAERAADNGIGLWGAADLPHLSERLAAWLDSRSM
ncbi:MAG TPA: DUF1887 family CARF protein [Rhodocyclaceae bacterium]|nr:DUF1887 family CARF protein [Rhodocyclaceae bacterium]